MNNTIIPNVLQMNTVYYVEEVCRPYVESLNRAYFNIAIFNVGFAVALPILEKFKDKILLKLHGENYTIKVTVGDVKDVLMVVFTILNVFGFGYWLILNTDIQWFTNLPIIRWFW